MIIVRLTHILCLAFLVLCTHFSFGQTNLGFVHFDEVAVVKNGDTLKHAWAGGLNNPVFSSLDLNLDGTNDLVAFDRDGSVYRMFRWKNGSAYESDMNAYAQLPHGQKHFVLMRDYNGDGKQDIFVPGYNNQGLDVYLNTSSSSELSFVKTGNRLKFRRETGSALFFIFNENYLPAFDDYNGDGDLDILIEGQVSQLSYPALLYIENLSEELYQNNDSLVFKLTNPCWGKIREYATVGGWTEYECDTANLTEGEGSRGNRHGGTTLTTFDVNGDGYKDILTGDADDPHLTVMYNSQSNTFGTVDLSLSDSTFPSYDVPSYVPNISAAYMEDVDRDGTTDMLVSPNQLTAQVVTFDSSINTNVDWYYRNTGTNGNPHFELQSKGFLSGEMIDVGSNSMPALADVNDDGLIDLIIGNQGYNVYGGELAAELTIFLNVGDENNPVFAFHESNVSNMRQYGFGTIHPTLTDLDDDGDVDLMIGDDQGSLHYFRNDGTPTNYDFNLTEPMFADIDVDLGAHPQFFDGNLDGVPDLMIGDFYGRIHYHENAGSNTEHDFSKNATIEQIGDILTFQEHGGESTPYFTRKLDSLGTKLYLLQSNADGMILVYGPIPDINAMSNPMTPSDSIVVEATYTSITGANLFGDYRHELIIGQRTGGLFAMKRAKEIPIGFTTASHVPNQFEVYPNPGDGVYRLKMTSSDSQAPINLEVRDVSGALIKVISIPSNKHGDYSFDISMLPDGVYLVSLKQNDQTHWARVVKL